MNLPAAESAVETSGGSHHICNNLYVPAHVCASHTHTDTLIHRHCCFYYQVPGTEPDSTVASVSLQESGWAGSCPPFGPGSWAELSCRTCLGPPADRGVAGLGDKGDLTHCSVGIRKGTQVSSVLSQNRKCWV